MDNAWKNKLRERFSDYSVPEPEGLWEGIEQGLSGKARRRMAPVWWLSGGLAAAAAVALVVFLPGSGARFSEPVQKDAIALVEPEDPAEMTGASETAGLMEPASSEVVSSTKESHSLKAVVRRTLLADAAVIQEDTVRTIDGMKVYSGQAPAMEMSVPVNPVDAEKVIQSITDAIQKQVHDHKPAEVEDVPEETAAFDPEERAALRRRFSISLYSAGGQNAADRSEAFGLARTGEFLTRATSGGSGEGNGLVRMLSANRASTYEARHQAPFRMGVKVAWQMTGHLSLVSGLNWTSLRSEFEESTASTRTLTKQDLGYLGIPLQLEASFNPWNRLWLYAGAGGMVEKGLVASSTTSTYIGTHLEDRFTGRPGTGGLLWSAGASAGAEYRFSRHVGVYFAPGLEYHFDNGAGIQSAYTEHPLHWNLALGLRLNFGNH